MAKFTAIPVQTVEGGENVLLLDSVRCRNGYVLHSTGSGIVTLRGVTNNCYARYRVTFGANVAIPTGGTVAPIEVALAVNGEALGTATAIVTPAAAGDFWNIFVADEIDVPGGCCITVSVRNLGDDPIEVENGNLIVTRIA